MESIVSWILKFLVLPSNFLLLKDTLDSSLTSMVIFYRWCLLSLADMTDGWWLKWQITYLIVDNVLLSLKVAGMMWILLFLVPIGNGIDVGFIFLSGLIMSWVLVLLDKYGLFCKSVLLLVFEGSPLKNPSCRVSLNYFKFLFKFHASIPLDEFLLSPVTA